MSTSNKGWIETYAKIGYAAKGIVYFLMGTLTAMTAIGIGGEKASNTDAMQQVNNWPGGSFLLILLGIGLLGYSLWRFIQAIKDTEDKGNSAKGILKRVAFAFSGLLYGGLAFVAFKIAISNQRTSEGGERERMVASELLEKPFGKWLALLIGFIIIGNGLYQIVKAYKGSFMKEVSGLPANLHSKLVKAGRAGFTARGIVFAIIGFLFVKAVWSNNPQNAEGTEGAFTFLQTSPFGSYLLAIVAIGLMCYGIFMLVQAKYSHVQMD